ncbi:MAG: hypothetical protein JW915_04715 [Chitinispirillaceae bacterium]|nr:hypothetical protein [Chitinispirillaceae bacterium]
MKMILAKLILFIYLLKQVLKAHCYIFFENLVSLFTQLCRDCLGRLSYSA